MVVTALGDRQIGVVARRREHAAVALHSVRQVPVGVDGGLCFLRRVETVDVREDLVVGGAAEKQVQLRQRLLHLLRIFLHHAADGHEKFAAPGFFVVVQGEDGVDRLLLRRCDEATGVDDDDRRLCRLLHKDIVAVCAEPHHVLRIDGVLGAAQCDKANCFFHASPSFSLKYASHSSRLMLILRALLPSYGPTKPSSSSSSMIRAARV